MGMLVLFFLLTFKKVLALKNVKKLSTQSSQNHGSKKAQFCSILGEATPIMLTNDFMELLEKKH